MSTQILALSYWHMPPHFKLIVMRGASEFWSPSKLSWQAHRFSLQKIWAAAAQLNSAGQKIQRLGSSHTWDTWCSQSSVIPSPCRCALSPDKLTSHACKCADSLLLSFHADSVSKWQEPLLTHTLRWVIPGVHSNTGTLGKVCEPYAECLQGVPFSLNSRWATCDSYFANEQTNKTPAN